MFILNDEGFIIPCGIRFALSPDIETGLRYITLLRPRYEDSRLIVVNDAGRIEGMTL